jgi:hypothetical protein
LLNIQPISCFASLIFKESIIKKVAADDLQSKIFTGLFSFGCSVSVFRYNKDSGWPRITQAQLLKPDYKLLGLVKCQC